MGHVRLLFIGSRKDLWNIYNDCPDSSSESCAEMAIGADYIDDWDWLDEKDKKRGITTDDFTKANKELYQQILDCIWEYCFDIKDRDNYGDCCCMHCPDHESENGILYKEILRRNKLRTVEYIKTLPDDTVFHFADSHW